MGNQVDILKPKVVPQVNQIILSFCINVIALQFAGPNEATMGAAIAAGPSNSVVIDKQGMYWMAGKVLTFEVISCDLVVLMLPF